jgi:hypothetical protein
VFRGKEIPSNQIGADRPVRIIRSWAAVELIGDEMKKLTLGILVALLTFAVGIAAGKAWFFSHRQVSIHKLVSPYEKGEMEAARDIGAGKLIIRTYGEPIVGYYPDKEILAKDYGVELKAVAGCVVSEELVENVRGYNEAQQAEIERRFGEGILGKVERQAQQVYKEYVKRHPNRHE